MHLKVNLLKHALQGSDVLLIEINMVRAKEILPELFTGAPLTLLIYSEITDADMTAGRACSLLSSTLGVSYCEFTFRRAI